MSRPETAIIDEALVADEVQRLARRGVQLDGRDAAALQQPRPGRAAPERDSAAAFGR